MLYRLWDKRQLGDDLVLTGDLLLELCHEYRGEYADDAEDDEHPAHGGCEQAAYIAVADAQRAAQALFADGSKDEREGRPPRYSGQTCASGSQGRRR